MQFPNQDFKLRIQLDAKHCEVSASEREKMMNRLMPLDKLVRTFPISDLYITVIHHARSNDFHVKTSLVLTGKTIFTGDRDVAMLPAFDRCARKLAQKVQAYKDEMSDDAAIAKHEKGTYQEIVPPQEPDSEQLNGAVDTGDYKAFRTTLFVYEEPLRKRIGRWIERYPQVETKLGKDLTVADIVEEVFLNAFEDYQRRPKELRLSDWLESLIDPSVKALLLHPDEELENVRFARTMTETESE